jgi:hypothetical protein
MKKKLYLEKDTPFSNGCMQSNFYKAKPLSSVVDIRNDSKTFGSVCPPADPPEC